MPRQAAQPSCLQPLLLSQPACLPPVASPHVQFSTHTEQGKGSVSLKLIEVLRLLSCLPVLTLTQPRSVQASLASILRL